MAWAAEGPPIPVRVAFKPRGGRRVQAYVRYYTGLEKLEGPTFFARESVLPRRASREAVEHAGVVPAGSVIALRAVEWGSGGGRTYYMLAEPGALASASDDLLESLVAENAHILGVVDDAERARLVERVEAGGGRFIPREAALLPLLRQRRKLRAL